MFRQGNDRYKGSAAGACLAVQVSARGHWGYSDIGKEEGSSG